MPHRRNIAPALVLEKDSLTRGAAGIGMRLASAPDYSANIEDTLIAASIEGMERDDLRMLAMLVTWIGIHSAWINADRLVHLAKLETYKRVRAFWSGIATWLAKDHRFARLTRLHHGSRVDLLRVGSEFQIRRRGEDPRFESSPLRVPAGALRDRIDDVLSPAELSRVLSAYRWRVIIGPSYRADMWAALKDDPSLTAAALARRTYGSFATAWRVKRDFDIARGA